MAIDRLLGQSARPPGLGLGLLLHPGLGPGLGRRKGARTAIRRPSEARRRLLLADQRRRKRLLGEKRRVTEGWGGARGGGGGGAVRERSATDRSHLSVCLSVFGTPKREETKGKHEKDANTHVHAHTRTLIHIRTRTQIHRKQNSPLNPEAPAVDARTSSATTASTG